MSHRNVDDSNSSSTSSDGSEGEDYDEEEEEDDEIEQVFPITKMPIITPQHTTDKMKTKDEELYWGYLAPYESTYLGIELHGQKTYIGSNANGLLDNVSVEVCFTYMGNKEVTLEITSPSGFVFVNQKCIRKGDKVSLKERDEIGFYYSKTYIFTLFFHEVAEYRVIRDSKTTSNGIKVFHKDVYATKVEIPLLDHAPTPVRVEDTLHSIFNKFGRQRIGLVTPEEKEKRERQNKETLRYLKPSELEALMSVCKIPFENPELMKYSKSLPSLQRTILMTIQKGGLRHLTRVVEALADQYDVPLLSVNYENIGIRMDVKCGEKALFRPGDYVQYVGKGKKQKDNDEIELGTKGVVLFVKGNHAAVNFDVFNKATASFVDVEYLAPYDEDVPETDHRIIGKLEELIEYFGRKGEDGKGKMIILFNSVSLLNDNQSIHTDFKQFLRTFKFSDSNALIVGTMATNPQPKKLQLNQQVDQSLCMLGMKDFKIETVSLTKQNKDQQKDLSNVSKLFTNVFHFNQPVDEMERKWRMLMSNDTKQDQYYKNLDILSTQLRQIKITATKYPTEEMMDKYTPEQIEAAIGIAIQHARRRTMQPCFGIGTECQQMVTEDQNLPISELLEEDIQFGLSTVKEKRDIDIDMIETDNEFEKRLLSDVVRSKDINVSFDDIGALDDVKEVLHETITLPLKRSELFFSKLTQGAKGVLLFGPPGTGKTMLAKAVATESKANFINVSLSSLGSKWFGEAEKFVKALFTLASKLSPCVIFIDEVDALLGRRSTMEHEAIRKMKNEFMSLWDGLKSKETERVIVMAATNRPFDLDEAVLRRLSRRILVDLPNEKNRVSILKKILRNESLEENFNYGLIAQRTDGFSGSDLFSLSQMVAMRPIREYLEKEAKEMGGKQKYVVDPKLRALTTQDFIEEMKNVNPSVSKESSSLTELRKWNNLFGEGSKSNVNTLKYFI